MEMTAAAGVKLGSRKRKAHMEPLCVFDQAAVFILAGS